MAFNVVDHDLLLTVLNKAYNIGNDVLNRYKKYLKPQRIKVAINSKYSEEKFSIPQGSVQGAFLFIAYASTIQDVIKEDLSLNGFDHSLRRPFNSNQINSGNSTMAIIENSMQAIKS